MASILKYWERLKQGEDRGFEEVEKSFSQFLKYQAWKFSSFTYHLEFDDFYSVGLAMIWKAIKKYSLICPICKKEFDSIKKFARHCNREHKKICAPFYSIGGFVRFRVLSKFQSEIRKEISLKRKPSKPIISIQEHEIQMSSRSGNQGVDQFNLCDLIDVITNEFDELEQEVIDLVLKDYSFPEIIVQFETKSEFSNKSAWRFVQKTKRKFCKYFLKEIQVDVA